MAKIPNYLWVAFAKRGFGYLADDGGNSMMLLMELKVSSHSPCYQELKIKAQLVDQVIPGRSIGRDRSSKSYT